MNLSEKLQRNKMVFGMVHVGALPGTPKYKNNWQQLKQKAVEEAEIFQSAGLDGIILENMHDLPYIKRKVGPEIVACMTAIANQVKKKVEIPVGIQVLAGANKEAMAVAKAAKLQFVRCEGFIFAHIADEGFIESDAGELLRYRKMIDAEEILIFTDIKKKHSSHNITNDITLEQTATAAHFFLSDGLIISGSSTGKEIDIISLKTLSNINIPILLGSGLTANNINDYWNLAHGFIIGSYFKKYGEWQNSLDENRIKSFMQNVNSLKTKS